MVLEGLLSQCLKAKLAHHVLNTLPAHTVLTNKGFQRKPPKEAESCQFKKEESQQSEGQGGKNVEFQSFHPPS